MIPLSWLNDLEIAAAEAVLAEREGQASHPSQVQEAEKSVVKTETPPKPVLNLEKPTVQPIIPAVQNQDPAAPSLPAPEDKDTEVEAPSGESQPEPVTDERSEAEKLLEELYKLPESDVRGQRENKEGSRHVEGDGLVFDPLDIERKVNAGYVIPHDDHYHVIPFSWLNDLEIQAAEAVLAERAQGKKFETKQTEATDQQKQSENTASESKPVEKTEKEVALENWRSFDKKAKGKDGKPYDTSDGYVFEADTVVEIYEDSFLAEHGDHVHLVYYSELEDDELVALADFWFSPEGQEKAQAALAKKEQEEATLAGRDLEPRLAMDPMDLPHMLMWVSEDRGTSFVVPHGDHFHYYDYANLSDEVIQTTKYLIQNPDERPKRPEGYIGYREEGPAPIVYEGETEAEIYDNMDRFVAEYAEREGIDEGDLWDKLFEISAYYEFQIDRADLMPGKVWRYMVGDQAYYYDLESGQYIPDNAEAEAMIKAAEAANPLEEDLNTSTENPAGETLEEEEALDPEEERIAKAAEAFGYPDMDAFYDNLITWALRYKVSVGDMDFNTDQGTITLNAQNGERLVIDGQTGEVIEDSERGDDKQAEEVVDSPAPEKEETPEEIQPAQEEESSSPAEEVISEDIAEEDEDLSGAGFPIFQEDPAYAEYLHKKILVDLGLMPAEELEPFIIEDLLEEPEPVESVLTNEGPYGPVGEFAPDGQTKATPLAERAGKENWKIVYSDEEVEYAKSKGMTTTSDGYIFKATDITYFDGFGYVTPHTDHIHYTPAKNLSETERQEAEEFWAANNDRLEKELEAANSTGSESSTDQDNQTESPAGETEKPVETKKLTLRQRYDAAEAKLNVPVNQLTGSTKYTTALTSDYKLIMPHHDHYHYLAIEELDGLYGVEGYTTDKIFSTIKYMIQNPDARPNDGSGWGSSAEIAQEATQKAEESKPESQASDQSDDTSQGQVREETTSEETEPAETPVEETVETSQVDPAHLYDDAWDVPTSGIHIERFNGVTEREFYSDGTVGLVYSDGSKVYYNGATGQVVTQPLSGAIQLEL